MYRNEKTSQEELRAEWIIYRIARDSPSCKMGRRLICDTDSTNLVVGTIADAGRHAEQGHGIGSVLERGRDSHRQSRMSLHSADSN